MQAQFDKLVAEFTKDSSPEDAILEALDCIKELGGDTTCVFLYETSAEMNEKVKFDSRCITVEKAADGRDTYVNANFALQGIKQILLGNLNDKVTIGCWKIVESRSLFQTVLKLLPDLSEKDDDDDDDNNIDKDDDDEDDEEENKILETIQPLDFLCMLLKYGISVPDRIHDPINMYNISTDMMQTLYHNLDEEMTESRIVKAYLDFFESAFHYPQNREEFRSISGVDLLSLVRKVNVKNDHIVKKIDAIISSYF